MREMVGRERELEAARAAFERAVAGDGSVVLVFGEAGIGKSSLLEEVARHAEASGSRLAWGRCWDTHDAPPWWPWKQVLRALDGDPAGLPDELWAAFDQVGDVLRAVEGPFVVLLDDLHAADELSLLLLRFLAPQLSGTRILVVGTYRPEDVWPGSVASRVLAEVSRRATNIGLSGLSDAESALCFERVAGLPPPRSLESALHRATHGNPLLISEMARAGAVGQELQRADRSVGFRVPRGAREVIEQRIGRVDTSVRQLLEVAAVIGYEFSLPLLEHITGKSPGTLVDALNHAEGHAIVRQKSTLGDYQFAFPLIRDALYESMRSSDGVRLHHEIAKALEQVHSNDLDCHLGKLAHHYFKAGLAADPDKALAYARRAAEQAEGRAHHEEAARHFYRALKLAQALGADQKIRDDLTDRLNTNERFSRAATESPEETSAEGTFVREGEIWNVTFAGRSARFKHTKGFIYLAELLAHPGREFLALDLASPSAPGAGVTDVTAEGLSVGAGDAGELLDDAAKAAYRRRLKELQEEIDEAEAFNDPERSARSREEMDFLTRELATGVGLGGRDRKASSAVDRARMSVTRAVRSAMQRIAQDNPELGRHLEATIRTGTYVSYTPDPRTPPPWQISP